MLCRQNKAHLVVVLFDHALRGKCLPLQLGMRPAGQSKVVGMGREKRCLERGLGQTDPLLPESCSGANSVGWIYQTDY